MNPTVYPGSAANSSMFAPLMRLRDWLDARGRPAWIVAMILGFVIFWPIGLAILGYLIWSKRMFSCHRDTTGHHSHRYGGSSGNSAFDAYRAETLKRLEEEQREFQDFMRHLREAKDKAEFDEFMRSRAARSENPAE